MKKLLITALTAGLVLAPQAVATAASATGASATGASATGAPATASDPILTGKRQIVIKPIPSFESIVAIDSNGRLNLIDGEAEFVLFVLSPVGDKYQIKTAKAGDGTKRACIGIKNNGNKPLTAVAATCDVKRAGQLFDIDKLTARDNGLPTYAISNAGAYLQDFPRTGLIAQELGDAELATTFSFVDNGPAPQVG